MRGVIPLLIVSLVVGCVSSENDETASGVSRSSLSASACANHAVHVSDLHADFREIWKGLEAPATGKQATPNASVSLEFSAAVQPASVSGSFVPAVTDGSCGSTIPTALASAVIASDVWGTTSTNASRKPQPVAFNVLALESISGVTSAAGALAAGGNITLTSTGINGTSRQPFGLVAGGKVTLGSGSISGNVTFGIPSTIPQTVSVSGQASQKPFLVEEAFQSLREVANLVASEPATGSVQLSYSTLNLTGTSSGVNVFRVAASTLQRASSVQISVPSGAGAIVDVTGANVQLQSKGISLQGATSSTLLWNLARATALNISAVSLPGSVLAPQARVTMNGGDVNGTLVVRSLTSSSGSLQYSALKPTLVFGSSAPNAVTLMPLHPLIRGCTYQFSISNTTVLSSSRGCLDSPLSVTFGVAKDHLVPADRELVDTQLEPSTQTLGLFVARKGINSPANEALARYESSIGIAVADLVAGAAKPSFISRTQLVTAYQQVSQGYSVSGYGYFVSSDNGIFRSAVGKVAPNLPSVPAPSVTSATALQAVLKSLHIAQAPWVVHPSVYHAPTGQLIIFATKEFPTTPDFKLVWSFQLGRDTGLIDPAEVQVDAATAAIVGREPGLVSFGTLDTSKANYQQQLQATFTSVFNGSPALSVAQYLQSDGTPANILATHDVKKDGVLATGTGIDLSSLGNPSSTALTFAIDPTPNAPWSASPQLARMASAQWAIEEADAFMSRLGLKVGETPWSKIDGVGKQKVFLNYSENSALSGGLYVPDFSDATVANIFLMATSPSLPVSPTTVSHEYGHALMDSMRRGSGLHTTSATRESGSISEGVADLFALGFNQGNNLFTPWPCFFQGTSTGDPIPCLRNIANPSQSSEEFDGFSGQPEDYKGLFYKDFSNTPASACDRNTNDNCAVHLNSSIVSHWGYLLAAGASMTGPCELTLAPCWRA
jgi:choice-of-anchor A domain-containing protein